MCFSESLESKETLLADKFKIRSFMSEQSWWLTQLSLLLCCPVNGTQEIHEINGSTFKTALHTTSCVKTPGYVDAILRIDSNCF